MRTFKVELDGSGAYTSLQEAYDACLLLDDDVELLLGEGAFGDLLLTDSYNPKIKLTGKGADLSFVGRIYSESDPGVSVFAYWDGVTVGSVDVPSEGGYGATVSVKGTCKINRINARSERSFGGKVYLNGASCPDIDIYGGEEPGHIEATGSELHKISKGCGRCPNKEAVIILKDGSFIRDE